MIPLFSQKLTKEDMLTFFLLRKNEIMLLMACTKTRNNETKRPKRNHRNERNETTEMSETSETAERTETSKIISK